MRLEILGEVDFGKNPCLKNLQEFEAVGNLGGWKFVTNGTL